MCTICREELKQISVRFIVWARADVRAIVIKFHEKLDPRIWSAQVTRASGTKTGASAPRKRSISLRISWGEQGVVPVQR